MTWSHTITRVEALLDEGLRQKIGSGYACAIGNFKSGKSHDFYKGTTSHFEGARAIDENISFDLASLTKILATTTLAMHKVERQELALTDHIRSLLSHTSGLPAWRPFYEEMKIKFGEELPRVDRKIRREAFDQLVSTVSEEYPRGEKIVYSDLGFLQLEKILSRDFENEVQALWRGFAIQGLQFRPVVSWHALDDNFAMTEVCPWRGPLQGQVHDDNCWTLGGASGHAGAFGRLQDVKAWVNVIFSRSSIAADVLRQFTAEAASVDGVRRALGFDFSETRVGHLGFTGTSLWVDQKTGDYEILLTNRVHPSRDDIRIRKFREQFYEIVRPAKVS